MHVSVDSLHVFDVHAIASSAQGGVPAMQIPAWHLSWPLQNKLSLHCASEVHLGFETVTRLLFVVAEPELAMKKYSGSPHNNIGQSVWYSAVQIVVAVVPMKVTDAGLIDTGSVPSVPSSSHTVNVTDFPSQFVPRTVRAKTSPV